MSAADCAFPLFRRKFLGAALWNTTESTGFPPMDAGNPGSCVPGMHHLQRPNLKSLDLKALPRDDGPPSETQLRRQKYLYFEKHCSEVAQGLFLAGDYVAKNRELLQQNRVTHVVNCVGFVCKEYFKGELDYKTYYLQGAVQFGSCVDICVYFVSIVSTKFELLKYAQAAKLTWSQWMFSICKLGPETGTTIGWTLAITYKSGLDR